MYLNPTPNQLIQKIWIHRLSELFGFFKLLERFISIEFGFTKGIASNQSNDHQVLPRTFYLEQYDFPT